MNSHLAREYSQLLGALAVGNSHGAVPTLTTTGRYFLACGNLGTDDRRMDVGTTRTAATR